MTCDNSEFIGDGPVIPIGGVADRLYDVIEQVMERARKVGISSVDELIFIRDILRAIREPTPAMISDGAFQITTRVAITEQDREEAARVWDRMIKAALAELPTDILGERGTRP